MGRQRWPRLLDVSTPRNALGQKFTASAIHQVSGYDMNRDAPESCLHRPRQQKENELCHGRWLWMMHKNQNLRMRSFAP